MQAQDKNIFLRSISRDGSLFASSEDGGVSIRRASDFQQIFTASWFAISIPEISSDNTRLIAAAVRGEVRVWNFATGLEIGSATQIHIDNLSNIVISSDGKHAASRSGSEGIFWIW